MTDPQAVREALDLVDAITRYVAARGIDPHTLTVGAVAENLLQSLAATRLVGAATLKRTEDGWRKAATDHIGRGKR